MQQQREIMVGDRVRTADPLTSTVEQMNGWPWHASVMARRKPGAVGIVKKHSKAHDGVVLVDHDGALTVYTPEELTPRDAPDVEHCECHDGPAGEPWSDEGGPELCDECRGVNTAYVPETPPADVPAPPPGFTGVRRRTLAEAKDGDHVVRFGLYRFHDGSEVAYLEAHETHDGARPGRVMALSTVVHLVQNVDETVEVWQIGARETPGVGMTARPLLKLCLKHNADGDFGAYDDHGHVVGYTYGRGDGLKWTWSAHRPCMPPVHGVSTKDGAVAAMLDALRSWADVEA